jgi:hypothetical protein
MVRIQKFYKNGRRAWDVKASAIVIAVIALLVMGLVGGESTADAIAALFTKVR